MRSYAILLATYNGESHLQAQLGSLHNQSVESWRLYIRDDSSIDTTNDVLSRYLFDSTCFKVFEIEGQLGCLQNFGFLATAAYEQGESYFFFSDQDDVWESDKLAVQSQAMYASEVKYPDSSILVYSDMSVVDSCLNLIAPSFMHYQGLAHESRSPLSVLLAQNFVTGCATMVNRRLLEVALPFPKEAILHDWWLALCAAAMGHIEYIDKPLVKYRQHGGNQVGAKSLAGALNPLETNWWQRWQRGRENLSKSMVQARALAERIRLHDPENENLPLIDAYAGLAYVSSPTERLKRVRSLGVYVQSPIRYALFLSRILFLNGK